MNFDIKLILLIAMIFLHIVDDYYLQGVLANMKQQSWWAKNAPDWMYHNDYITALITHAFSWTFVMMLPIAVCMICGFITAAPAVYIIWFIWNVWMHAIIDNDKANKKEISLTTDQCIHLFQIFITWLNCFIIF